MQKPAEFPPKGKPIRNFSIRPHIVDTDIDCGRRFCGRHSETPIRVIWQKPVNSSCLGSNEVGSQVQSGFRKAPLSEGKEWMRDQRSQRGPWALSEATPWRIREARRKEASEKDKATIRGLTLEVEYLSAELTEWWSWWRSDWQFGGRRQEYADDYKKMGSTTDRWQPTTTNSNMAQNASKHTEDVVPGASSEVAIALEALGIQPSHSVIDYSKWDHLSVSSSGDKYVESEVGQSEEETMKKKKEEEEEEKKEKKEKKRKKEEKKKRTKKMKNNAREQNDETDGGGRGGRGSGGKLET